MDLIESLVLYEHIVLDTACRTARFGEREVHESLWSDVYDLRDRRTGKSIVTDEPYRDDEFVAESGLLSTAIAKLLDCLAAVSWLLASMRFG